jgi:Kef-type K+ transport system membrane component KefB
MFVAMKTAGKIFFSMILGLIMAFLVSKISVYLKRREDVLTFILGAILINTGIALFFHMSPLLSNMFFGAELVNIEKTSFRFFDSLNTVDWPLYVMFYVIAGANLDIGFLSALGLIGSVYIISRIIGRIGGAYAGAVIVGAENSIKKYMGLALMAQAGVAIGLAMMAKVNFPHTGGAILNTIIATTVIYEILGPVATRYSLIKAGDV